MLSDILMRNLSIKLKQIHYGIATLKSDIAKTVNYASLTDL